MRTTDTEYPQRTVPRLLVAISPGPLCDEIIEGTRRLAAMRETAWLAVHVATPVPLSQAEQEQLAKNLAAARQLGAEVITTVDEDIVNGLLRVARQHSVTQIVIRKSAAFHAKIFFWRPTLLSRLLRHAGEIDVLIVGTTSPGVGKKFPFRRPALVEWRSYLLALAVLGLVTAANHVFSPVIGYRAVAMNYLLAIMLLAFVVGRGPMVMAATVSALVWNYLFLPPRFTFSIGHFEDAMMFVMYFVVAIILGQLIARIRLQEKAERRREEHSTALYLLTRDLAEANGLDKVVEKFLHQVQEVFQGEAGLILADNGKALQRRPHPAGKLRFSEHEMNTATWVFAHRQTTTPFTDTAKVSFLPLTTAKERIGVLAIKLRPDVANVMEYQNLLESFARQAALVINRQQLQEYAERTRLMAESERLGKNLLDSISHEMRTPIAAITTALSNLEESSCGGFSEAQRRLTGEIQIAADRLNRLVGNLLDITRVESGHLKPKMDWCEIGDLIHVTLKSIEKELAGHRVKVHLDSSLPLIEMDYVLMEQALTNLLLNAAHHTRPGTQVEVAARIEGKELAISISDSGRGLPPDALPRMFEKFYRVPGSPSGGTGLGLSIVKGFVEAQRGRVTVANRSEGGAIFTIHLPIKDPPTIPVSRE